MFDRGTEQQLRHLNPTCISIEVCSVQIFHWVAYFILLYFSHDLFFMSRSNFPSQNSFDWNLQDKYIFWRNEIGTWETGKYQFLDPQEKIHIQSILELEKDFMHISRNPRINFVQHVYLGL